MAGVTLRYGEDPATGLPRLEDPSGVLSDADLAALQPEIDRQFERLASGPDGQVLALNGATRPGLPSHFRVTVTQREKRCPTLLLEALDAPSANADSAAAPTPEPSAGPDAPPVRWQAQFLAEVAELLADAADGDLARGATDFVLADLRAL